MFNSIRGSKQSATRLINKLTVNGKVYTGDSVPDGFYDSLLDLKLFDSVKIQDPVAFERYEDDYQNIIKLCRSGSDIPEISLEVSTDILGRIRPAVTDFYCVTANHFINVGEVGIQHFHHLLKNLIGDINNISVDEVNTVHAAILF